MLWISIVIALVSVGNFIRGNADCDCEYHPGGCTIRLAAPVGFKCRCSYKGFWTCSGVPYPCVGEEKCPGSEADYCACKLGGGDCDGYINPKADCTHSRDGDQGIPSEAECDCSYSPGGCRIASPAPFGWKCVCSYKGFWTCSGWAQRCQTKEICLGGDYSYCGCQQGGGDCDAYPDQPSCPSPYLSKTCNCNRAADWSKGLFKITGVEYHLDNKVIHNLTPTLLAEKEIPNPTSETQSTSIAVTEALSTTSTFSHTEGVSIDAGVEFDAGIPIIKGISLKITGFYQHTFGESYTNTTSVQNSFTCNAAPRKYTKCSVIMQKAKVSVPYTMNVQHKIIPNCVCGSSGVWAGTQAYQAKLLLEEKELSP